MADRNFRQTPTGQDAEKVWGRLLSKLGLAQTSEPRKAPSERSDQAHGSLWGRVVERAEKKRNAPASKQAKKLDLDDLSKDLARIASARDFIAAGKIQILNIEPVVEHFGDKWPDIKERAHRIIGQVLDNHLSERDIWRRHEEFIYVVVFANMRAEEARGRMALISEDIREKLVGEEPSLAKLNLQSATYNVDGEVVLSDYAADDAIAEIIDHQAVTIGDEDPENAPNSHSHVAELSSDDSLLSRLEEVKSAHEKIEARLARLSATSDNTSAHIAEFRLLSSLEDELLRLHDRLARRVPLAARTVSGKPSVENLASDIENPYPRPATILLMNAENALMQEEGDKRIFEDPDNDLKLTFAYRPAWHVGQNIVGTYFATAYFEESSMVQSTESAYRHRLSTDICALIDRCLLRRTVVDLLSDDAERSSLIGVPVHYSTLRHTAHRETHQYLMHTTPVWLRDYVVWEVIGAPKDLMRSQIDEVASILMAVGNSVIWRTSLYGASLKQFSGTRVRTVSVHLEERIAEERNLTHRMEKWVTEAKPFGFTTYVRGADKLEHVARAAETGVDRISGDAVKSRVEVFGGAKEFTPDLFMS